MSRLQPLHEFSVSIPSVIAGLQISLICRLGLLAVDAKSAQFSFSVFIKIINLR